MNVPAGSVGGGDGLLSFHGAVSECEEYFTISRQPGGPMPHGRLLFISRPYNGDANFWEARMKAISISLVALLAGSVVAVAQSPTAAQKQAVRSSCAADYRANCSSIPPGGMASLVCLEQHASALSPSCQSAVDAIAGTKAPAATPSTPAPAPPAAQQSDAGAPTGTPTPTHAQAPKPKPLPPSAPRTLRGEMRLAASACFADFARLCPNLPIGHGNVMGCLREHRAALDPACRSAMARAHGE